MKGEEILIIIEDHHKKVFALLDKIISNQQILIQNQNKIMATLADIQTEVAAEDTVIDSAIALLNGLAAQVAALQPNQEAIDALAADITAKTQALSQAVVTNTPAS